MLDEFSNWCNVWRVQLNPTKTQTILFKHPNHSQKPSQRPEELNLTLLEERLVLQDEACYLGVTFTRTLNWQPDLDKTLNKVRKRASILRALGGKFGRCHPDTLIHTETRNNVDAIQMWHSNPSPSTDDLQKDGLQPAPEATALKADSSRFRLSLYRGDELPPNQKNPPVKLTPPQNGPSLSYVVRDVDKLYTDEDLKEHFEETELNFTKCWRIFSRVRGEATKMIRVITHDPNSYSDKIARGLFIYGRMHKCEPSFAAIATPQVEYCNKCCKSGHLLEECQERKMVCPFCSGEHRSAECKQTSEPKCLNCNGLHPAFSHKCPERKKAPESIKQSAPILPIKLPPAPDLPNMMKTVMEYVTLMFMNLMPTDRGTVLHTNETISKHMFGWTCVSIPSPNGFQLHFKPITPPTV
ncbi:hypothetical protein JTB14_014925 [Gonioctena quinquepunctata]|nr:hypothetical protein JTB14_014925 [Gonioctena quinquepunctata]